LFQSFSPRRKNNKFEIKAVNQSINKLTLFGKRDEMSIFPEVRRPYYSIFAGVKRHRL